MNTDGEEKIEDRGGVLVGFESEVRLKLNLDKSSAREDERLSAAATRSLQKGEKETLRERYDRIGGSRHAEG